MLTCSYVFQESPPGTRRFAVELMDYGTENYGANVNSKSSFPFKNLPSPMSPAEPPSSD